MPLALAEDEAAHLRVPAARLVAEVDAGLQQLLDADLRPLWCSLVVCVCCRSGASRSRRGVTRRAGPRMARAGRVRLRSLATRASFRCEAFRGARRSPSPTSGVRRAADRPSLPYLRRTGPLFSPSAGRRWTDRSVARRARARPEVVGQRRADLDARAGRPGWSKARRAACRNWRSSPRLARRGRRTPGRRRPGGRSPRRCTRIWWVRPVSSRTRSSALRGQRALDLEVRASPRAARRCRSTCASAWRRSRPIGASIVPVRAGGRPSTSARYSRSILRARQRRPAAPGAPRRTARRRAGPTCRGRGGGRCPRATGPGRRDARPASSLRERARRGARAPGARRRRRACRRPAGARPRRRWRTAPRRARARAADRPRPPRRARRRRSRWRLGRGRPVDEHLAGVDQALGPSARAQRLRQEAVQPLPGRRGGDVKISHAASSSGASAAWALLDHVEQRQHAERDRDVGDVERRPQRQVDEVGHGAAAHAVDQVAERAAEQQARRQPEQRAGRCGGRSRRAGARARASGEHREQRRVRR